MAWRDRLRVALETPVGPKPPVANCAIRASCRHSAPDPEQTARLAQTAKGYFAQDDHRDGATVPADRAIIAVAPPPAALLPWYDAVANMRWMRPPLGFTAPLWRRVCLDAAGLLDVHGAEQLALGWTATDVLGLHATAPGVAVRCKGLAMLMNGGSIA